MATINFHRVTAIPGTLAANSVYLIAPAASEYAEIIITGASREVSRRTPRIADIQAMIDDAALGGGAGAIIVDDIAARDGLTPPNAQQVYVVDASADATVDAGGATYIWRASTNTWIKQSESESLDLVLSWAALVGKPSSTPAAIDTAVARSHEHANKTQLDQIGQDAQGNFTYGGNLPKTSWSTEAW